jgi:hypothetical protein
LLGGDIQKWAGWHAQKPAGKGWTKGSRFFPHPATLKAEIIRAFDGAPA